MSQDINQNLSPNRSLHLPALTGIRFFAIFHIFLFHLWVLYDLEKSPETANLMSGMSVLPDGLITYLSNGWMSTSFFFLLSGFILSYLYWGQDGALTTPKKRFWIMRAARLYPMHIIILLITFAIVNGYVFSQGNSVLDAVAGGLATLTLVQSWYPPFVSMWSWPTWTLSALVFLYLAFPWLMPRLAKLSRRRMIQLLIALPFISLIPTCVYAVFFPSGSEPIQNWQIFIGSTPIFWLSHFIAGMLMTKIFGITRYNLDFKVAKPTWFAWGDVALLAVIGIACIPNIEEPFKYFFRHGLMMPLYIVIIIDLAKGRGVAARLFSLPGTGFLGETGFSIFIWQNLVMVACWIAISINPELGDYQLIYACVGIIILSIISTYGIEKPIARWIRRKALA